MNVSVASPPATGNRALRVLRHPTAAELGAFRGHDVVLRTVNGSRYDVRIIDTWTDADGHTWTAARYGDDECTQDVLICVVDDARVAEKRGVKHWIMHRSRITKAVVH